ncbi:OmpA family protein [Hymenobacter sp. DG25A]|uniref:OmpA family protein n=1 Tax=Hymenobacter sp. DG25A TaxID=1385663 RepID=UPI0009EBB43E|nr:OmpA family protein [Hymenobacter sp. DG25A]
MRFLLTLVLALCCVKLQAQDPADLREYISPYAGYRLAYPAGWQVRSSEDLLTVDFWAPKSPLATPVLVELRIRPVPERQKDINLLNHGQLDSLWLVIRSYPQVRLFELHQRDAGSFQEIRYDYSYKVSLTDTVRTRVIGRRVWRGGYEFRLEYRALASYTRQYYAVGKQLLNSFALLPAGLPSRRYAEQTCDDKMYGIAALQVQDGLWEDDCRTIHEFSVQDPSEAPKIHRQVLPFQSYALAKGFDNCLYSVTKAPTNAPEYVYRYDPAAQEGRYTAWQLPAQGPENIWISAATDERGDLLFITSDASKLVKVSPTDNTVTMVWEKDPVRQAAYYPAIGFAGAGTHANFCIDDTQTLYQIYSTDGALLRVNLATKQPAPDLLPMDGLPEQGGYSDLLLQYDVDGNRVFYLAGPKALYQADQSKRQATRVRRGVYTDLAGCNLFRTAPRPAPASSIPPTTWRGRVLDAVTYQPLPQARLQLLQDSSPLPLPLTPEGAFLVSARPGKDYTVRAHLEGYVLTDSLYTPRSGPYGQDILLQPLSVGTTLRLEKVQFEQGKAVLLPASYPDLEYLLALLLKYPQLTIELRGHTDNIGDPQKNIQLSEQRVEVVKGYLVSHGISADRITGIGLGGAEPIASNAQEATRQLNRRVEFRVTGMQKGDKKK